MRSLQLKIVILTLGLASPFVLGSCGSSEPPTSPGSSGAVDGIGDLIVALQAAGAQVVRAGVLPLESNDFFSVPTTNLKVDGHTVHVWEYGTAEGAAAEAALVAPDGYEIGRGIVDWIGPPHWYRGTRILVLYVGTDENVISLLDGVLGRQFAGG